MAIPLYLAMTGAEFPSAGRLPRHIAWLSCRFSPWGQGLSNLPPSLPPGSVLILSDENPIAGHDPEQVKAQLEGALAALECDSLLLDFQRPATAEAIKMVDALVKLDQSVAVTERYAENRECPVFLSPVPPDTSPQAHLRTWKGREIWLEAAMDGITLQVTESGTRREPAFGGSAGRYWDEALYCHYDITVKEDAVCFHLQRTRADVQALMSRCRELGVTRALGLYQEFGP